MLLHPLPNCDLQRHLEKAVRLLNEIEPREAQILTLRFGLNGQEAMTLKEIGKEMGLTRERVRQIQRNALQRLNELMSEDVAG